MGRGIFALLLRSLRSDSRSLTTHLSWSLLVVGIYIALCMVFWNRLAMGAPGLGFVRNMAYLDAAVLCLLGTPFFSSSIAEERDEGTLGLMRMAGLNSLGILLGKSTGRLWQVLLLLAIQFPFWLLSITLGGVTIGQLWALVIGMSAFVIALSNVGLLCSVLCSSTRSAAAITGICVAVHLLSGFMERSLFGASRWCERTSFWFRISTILATGFNESVWSMQVGSNLLVGIVCFVLSWCLFGTARDEIVTTESTWRLWSRWRINPLRTRYSNRVWLPACTWKDFHFVLGGWSTLAGRCLSYFVLFSLSGLFNFRSLAGAGMGWSEIHQSFQFALVFAIPFDAALLTAAAMQSDIRQQTLSTLMMLPQSVPKLIYSKLAGVVPGILPGILSFFWSGWVSPHAFFHSVDQFWVIFCWMVSVPHGAAALALFLRWGSVPVAFATTLGALLGSEALFHRIANNHSLHDFGLYCVCPMYSLLCLLCHMTILIRLPKLASR